ncbi:MAG TPA: hypothetical protein GXZ90_03910, partial [Clostridiales bacterium]|nr:hypothetical protein [Clostridiales bacterium]
MNKNKILYILSFFLIMILTYICIIQTNIKWQSEQNREDYNNYYILDKLSEENKNSYENNKIYNDYLDLSQKSE